MLNEDGIIVNKYGAVDIKVICDLIKEVKFLQVLLDDLINVDVKEKNHFIGLIRRREMLTLKGDIKKMKELTKCNDYEFQTKTETKLVKKKEVNSEKH